MSGSPRQPHIHRWIQAEERHIGGPSRPRIPHVCESLGVPCISVVTLASRYGPDFVEKPVGPDEE